MKKYILTGLLFFIGSQASGPNNSADTLEQKIEDLIKKIAANSKRTDLEVDLAAQVVNLGQQEGSPKAKHEPDDLIKQLQDLFALPENQQRLSQLHQTTNK